MLRRSLCFALTLALSALAFIAPARAAGAGPILISGNITASCATYTGCPTGSVLSTTISVPANITVQVSGTFSGTLQFEGSLDCANGNTIPLFAVGSTTTQTTTNAPGLFSNTVTNINCFQVRATAWGSGTASIYILVTAASSTASSGAITSLPPLPTGANTIGAVTFASGLNAGTNQIGVLNPWLYTVVTASGNTVVSGSPAVFFGVANACNAPQTNLVIAAYDNASTNSGNLLMPSSTSIGASQFGLLNYTGVKATNGITVNLSGAATCAGGPTGSAAIIVYWRAY